MSIKLKTASGSITLAPEDGSGDVSVTIPRAGVIPTKSTIDALGIAATSVTGTQASAISANTAKVTNATHTGDVTGGTVLTIATDAVDIAMLSATGTAGSTTFLRGDNTWATAGSTSASDLTSGTLADAIFPATLPAISGANLTNLPSGGVNMTSATTAPTSPSVGDQWYDTANGVLYVRVTDGTDAAWLDISSANGTAAAGGGGGAVELISSSVVSSDTNSVTFSSLDLTGYSEVNMVILGMKHNGGTSYQDPVLKINGADSTYRYGAGNTQNYGLTFSGDSIQGSGEVSAGIRLFCGSSSRQTMVFVEAVAKRTSSAGSMTGSFSSDRTHEMYEVKEAITSLTVIWYTGTYDISQGEFYLYGTKKS